MAGGNNWEDEAGADYGDLEMDYAEGMGSEETVTFEEAQPPEEKRVSRTAFLKALYLSLQANDVMKVAHNGRVGIFLSIINLAENFEATPGMMVKYYYNRDLHDIAVEGEEKHFGLLPTPLAPDEEVNLSSSGHRRVTFDEVGKMAILDQESAITNGYEQIDRTKFYIFIDQIKDQLQAKADELDADGAKLQELVDKVLDAQESSDLSLDFYYDPVYEAYWVDAKKKAQLGFGNTAK